MESFDFQLDTIIRNNFFFLSYEVLFLFIKLELKWMQKLL